MAKEIRTFGGPDAFYSGDGPRENLHKSDTHDRVESLLKENDPELCRRVERMVKASNQTLRDRVRNVCGLRLSVGDKHNAVPIKVVAGLPRSLEDQLKRFDKTDLELLYNQRFFSHGASVLDVVQSHFSGIKERLNPVPASLEDVQRTRELLRAIIALLNQDKLKELFGSIDYDFLGSYFYNVPEIRIYWMAIGLVAHLIDVSTEALTMVVLTHELAHAYTHLGLDNDRDVWDTEAFASADIYVVEGLAQFYTETVCKTAEPLMPLMYVAFRKLLELQPEPYTAYQEWTKEHKRAGEVIRASMIQFRAKREKDYEVFKKIVENSKENMPNTRHTKQGQLEMY